MREMNKKIWPGRARVTVKLEDHQNICGWLEQHLGEDWLINVEVISRNKLNIIGNKEIVRDYYFRTEELATLFALRWA